VTPVDEEDLQEQVLALRELVEGYRESHRSLFKQLREAAQARDEAEENFWSLVGRQDSPLTSAPWPEGLPSDPFEDLPLDPLPPDTLPPVTRRAGVSEELAEIQRQALDEMQGELELLRQENRELSTTNQELLWRIDELEKNQQAPPSVSPPSEQEIEAIRETTRQEVTRQFSAELARKEQDLAQKTAELIRTCDQLRRAAVDLELARGQIEEDAEELAGLRKKLETAGQAVESLRAQLAQARSAASRQEVPRAQSDRQEVLERQVVEWADKAHRQESQVRKAQQEIHELQLLVVRLAVGLGRAHGAWTPDPQSAAYRGLQVSFDTEELPDEALASLVAPVFPFPDLPSQPHYEASDAPLDTVEDFPDTEQDFEDTEAEDVSEDELLHTPMPMEVAAALETFPPSQPPSRTSLRPPPLPSTPPPPSDVLADPFADSPPPEPVSSTERPTRRNQTVGWTQELADPFPSSRPKTSRSQTMLGFSASPEQLAEQQKQADEFDLPASKKPRSGL
jgi:hypothetical protein